MTSRVWIVYRLYSFSGLLLYVGKSYEPGGFEARIRDHRSKRWGPWIFRWEIERYPTEEDALEAEEAAIRSERPMFPKVHSGGRGDAAALVLARRTSRA